MAEAEGGASAPAERIAGLDTSVAHPARVYDYWLGGKDNFAADREAAERVLAVAPGHEDPWGIVARLMAATPAGSYLTIPHPAIDIHHAQATGQRVYNERVSTPQTLRTPGAGGEVLHRSRPGRAGTGAGASVAAGP